MLLLTTLLLLLQFKSPFASAHDIHCVVPADYPPSTQSDGYQPCLTLDQLAELKFNFNSGTIVQFLPGNHGLELTLHLTEISNITFTRRDSNSTVNIICTKVGRIQCVDVTGLKIEGLRFLLAYKEDATAITFINCNDILIASTTFAGTEKGTGRAIHLQNTQANIWKCNFESNRVTGYGGAIFMILSTSLTINESSFIKNQAWFGGAVCVFTSSLLLYNNNFTKNYASTGGGAIQSHDCIVQMRGYNRFHKNYCDIKNYC